MDILAALKRRIKRALMSRAERRYELVGPPELWRMKRQIQIDFLKQHGLQPRHYLLDLGCGVLRGGIPIIDYLEPGHYYGIEARPYVLDEGRKELAESGLGHKRPHLLVAEHLAGVNLDQKFDYIWAFSVLIHLQDEIFRDLMQFVARHLKPDGVFYANVETLDLPDGEWQEFPGIRRPLAFYQDACAKNGLHLADLGSLAEFGHRTSGEADEQRMLGIRPVGSG